MAGRKTFVAGEILTAADVNSFLMDQSVMVFDNSTARGSAIPTPSEGMVTYLKDQDKIQQYTTDWEDVGRAGIGPNAVQTVKTDKFTTSSTSFVTVTGLSVTITPTSSTSKILVVAQITHGLANDQGYGHFKVTRGSTDVYVGDASGSRVRAVFGGFSNVVNRDGAISGSIIFLDSPGTTSATTYNVQVRQAFNGSVFINRNSSDFDNATAVNGASSISAIEVTS